MTSQSEESAPSALLSFTAENARSYRDEVTLSLLTTRLAAEGVPRSLTPAGMAKPVRVLPAAGIFGANASGKTTILRAMADMRNLVLTSFVQGSHGTPIPRQRFLLDSASQDRPTRFEVDLVLEGVRWVYGFEVNDERVLEEFAYHWPRGRQALVFQRDGDSVDFGSRFRAEDRALESLLRDNSLLLSVAGTTGNDQLSTLFDWFSDNLSLVDSSNRMSQALYTAENTQDQSYKARIRSLLDAADLGVVDLNVEKLGGPFIERLAFAKHLIDKEDEIDFSEFRGPVSPVIKISLTHRNSAYDEVRFDWEDESSGTVAWVSLIGPMLDALDRGRVLLIDELDSSLHPHLVARVIRIFQDPKTNPWCAQLIFNSHDGEVLEDREKWALGRDQIWFAEKYNDGDTKLYALDGFGPRRDEAIHHRYYQGRYGAIPVINDAAIYQSLVPVTT